MRWFRCYVEIRTDQKLLSLDDHQFRLWMHLLALVSEDGEKGRLHRFSGIHRALNTTEAKWERAKGAFVALNMVDVEDGGVIVIRNWGKRQFLSDDPTPRVQRHRNGQAPLPKRERNVTVTPPEDRGQKQRTETEISSPSSAREGWSARQWYEYVTGKLIGQDKALRQQLDDIQFAHGFPCVAWGFTAAIGKDDPMQYAKRIFDSCILGGEGHGPRRSDAGTGAGRNDLRPQGGGNHRRKPQEPDWERLAREIDDERRASGWTEAEIRERSGVTPGTAAAGVEQDV